MYEAVITFAETSAMRIPSVIHLKDLQSTLEAIEPKTSRLFVLCDMHTRRHCLPLLKSAIPGISSHDILLAGLGEQQKTMNRIIRLSHELIRRQADRNSVLINLGGGVVSDLGGFLASIYKRGIRFINIPTSLIGMVDAAHGGKTGVNSGNLKNQLGSFHFPECVVIHADFLRTLPGRHLQSGFAEMMKHGLLSESQHYHNLLGISAGELLNREDLILDSLEIKNRIVEQDAHESGPRTLLNLGHTVGHALESWSFSNKHGHLSHGHAVALGLAAEIMISARIGQISQQKAGRIINDILSRYHKPSITRRNIERLLNLMHGDKKNVAGSIRMPLLQDIGHAMPNFIVDESIIRECLEQTFL